MYLGMTDESAKPKRQTRRKTAGSDDKNHESRHDAARQDESTVRQDKTEREPGNPFHPVTGEYVG